MHALAVQGQLEEVVITKEMAEMEKNLQEEGERKEREIMEKVPSEHELYCPLQFIIHTFFMIL